MIITENLENGLVRRYSNSGMMIRQIETDALYSEAVDIVAYTYEETDIPIVEAEISGYDPPNMVEV